MPRRRRNAAAPAVNGRPVVRMSETADDSIAPTVFALIDRGAGLRPFFAAEMRGSILLCFNGAHPPVHVAFEGDAITVSDGTDAHAVDLRIDAALPDLVSLLAVPLSGGIPKPTSKKGRAALARIADGRVELDGPFGLGRKLLRLMSVVGD